MNELYVLNFHSRNLSEIGIQKIFTTRKITLTQNAKMASRNNTIVNSRSGKNWYRLIGATLANSPKIT